jgi:hypothetical protein
MAKIDNFPRITFVVGIIVGLVPWGLQMIGVVINLWAGAVVLLLAFSLCTYAFWIWKSASQRPKTVRILVIVVAAGICFPLIGRQVHTQYLKDHPVVVAKQPPQAPPPSASPAPQSTSPSRPKPVASKIDTHIEQHGNGNTTNSITVAAPVNQGPCSVNQIGGSGNQANVECPPPVKVTASPQVQSQTGNPESPYVTKFTISTNIPAEIGELRFTCSGPVVSGYIDRISEYELILKHFGPDPNDRNTLVYEAKPEALNPNRNLTIKIFSEAPIKVLSGTAGDNQISF